jgi:hypothetical protein
MKPLLDRRDFLGLSSACALLLSAPLRSQSASATVPPPDRTVTRNRKNFVAIQVKPFAWKDEGVDQLLDNIQNRGAVNTVWAYTYDYSEERMTKDGPIPLPDHGVPGGPQFVGGAFYDYDPKYFRNTILRDFRSPDYGSFNVIADVAPKVKARGMDFFAWDYNNAFPIMMRSIPNLVEVAEIDIYGRRTTSPCFNHPDYRAHLTGKVESVLEGYAGLVDGFTWGCERMGPLDNLIGGGWSTRGLCCFCRYCVAKGRDRGISSDRARAGYRKLDALFGAAAGDERPADGYFVTFWRILLEYPEILAWETLWTDSYHEVRSELYGTGKAIAPEKPFGFHIMQNMTFSPFYRAEEDYAKTKNYADFLKLATYNNAAGPRLASFLDRLGATVFRDAKPEEFLPFFYDMMGYHEASYDQLHITGLSVEYLKNETRRAIEGVHGSNVQIYPGIDIDVPTKRTDKRTTPEDVKRSVHAAFEAGANGVVLSREYVEMWLANLTAAGDALREVFANSKS